ncbi:hypothetical protein IFM89_025106 [Coptis chinensis]|uniref:DNA helicase n=1 Tax=Coptis chinensis TaxID=261450 RepID=A0A835HYD2_9MAGN|nr:hypothetical protein IFM89_025106 [Coptis chinensis]
MMMAATTELNNKNIKSEPSINHVEKTKTLIYALNLISRNLPLPSHIFHTISSIYHADVFVAHPPILHSEDTLNTAGSTKMEDIMTEFEDALQNQRPKLMSGLGLKAIKEIQLPPSRGEDLQMKCLLELYGLKLAELQSKVRVDVSSEYWLHEKCAYPDKQLFDWGMMRLRRPSVLYGMGDAFAMEGDDRQRKKRDTERLSRLEEEEKNRIETVKKKFFADILNIAREFQVQGQASLKRRKQRNDGVQSWHGRQRQRATRAEKLRFQALKADDQEAYMKMVEESKNERLTMLLEKTNDLLTRLGAAVKKQKDAEHSADIKVLKGLGPENPSQLPESPPKNGGPDDTLQEPDIDIDDIDSEFHVKTSDLLEGQRQYNSVVHSKKEEVTEQPSMLQGGELRPYQLEGLQWMLSLFNNHLNGILADEMGLGKTIQTIALIAYLMEKKNVLGPYLIVAPKAVLPNWVNEFSAWAPSIHYVLYDGRLEQRKAMREEYPVQERFNVMITHYDMIMRDKIYLKKFHWHYMIVDEGHRLKNHECGLAQTIFSSYRIRRRLLLTGTPIQNSLQELWSLLNFLLPSIFNSVENFEEWFNAPFADRGDVSLTDEEQLLVIRRLHQVIRPFILRRKKDEVEKFLPGKKQVILKCDLSAWQKVYYHQVTEEGRVGMDSKSGKSRGLQNLTMQLRKCCNHPYLFLRDYNIWQKEEVVRASGKFELLDRLLPKLRRAGHRVLLFSQMTRLMDILEVYLQLNDYKFLRLDGSTKTEERGMLVKQFNAPDSPFFMFCLSTRAGGLGLNLQTADTVIIFDSDWNPQMDQQAEDRAHRIGQTKEVRVFVLVSVGSIEEEILERAKQKMGIDAKVIQAGLFNNTSTGNERQQMLQEIMRRGTKSLGTDVPSEREINRLAARSEEEYWLFEKMDEERRRKENYQSRLIEEHEVPDWVYPSKEELDKDLNADGSVTGKRKRKDVSYADTMSEKQWLMAVENGEDLSIYTPAKSKRREHLPAEANELTRDVLGEVQVSESRNASGSMVSNRGNEDSLGRSPKRIRSISIKYNADEYEGVSNSGWNKNIVPWKTHKKKRSFNGVPKSSRNAKGQSSSSSGNGRM